MGLYRRLTEAVQFRPALMAQELLEDVTAVETELAEVRIYTTRDGRWLYCGNAGNAIPCVTATPDYQQIACYAVEPSDEVLGGAATRFLVRTAFECRFCYERMKNEVLLAQYEVASQ